MPDFDFTVLSVEPEIYAVAPTLLVQLGITNKNQDEVVLSINLLTEFHFDSPAKSLYWTSVSTIVRRFVGSTKSIVRLPCNQDSDLQVSKYLATVGKKTLEGRVVHIRVTCKKCRSEKESRVPKEKQVAERYRLTEEPCEVCGSTEYDVSEKEIAGSREGSDGRLIPLKLVFYGSAIYQTPDSPAINFFPFPQLPPKEAKLNLRASIWKSMMENHYGQARWISVKEGTFEQLNRYIETNRLASFDEALMSLMDEASKRSSQQV